MGRLASLYASQLGDLLFAFAGWLSAKIQSFLESFDNCSFWRFRYHCHLPYSPKVHPCSIATGHSLSILGASAWRSRLHRASQGTWGALRAHPSRISRPTRGLTAHPCKSCAYPPRIQPASEVRNVSWMRRRCAGDVPWATSAHPPGASITHPKARASAAHQSVFWRIHCASQSISRASQGHLLRIHRASCGGAVPLPRLLGASAAHLRSSQW